MQGKYVIFNDADREFIPLAKWLKVGATTKMKIEAICKKDYMKNNSNNAFLVV